MKSIWSLRLSPPPPKEILISLWQDVVGHRNALHPSGAASVWWFVVVFSLFITSCLLIIRLIHPRGEKCSNLLHFVVLAGSKVKAVSSVNITRIWVASVVEVDEKEHIGKQLSNIYFLVARCGQIYCRKCPQVNIEVFINSQRESKVKETTRRREKRSKSYGFRGKKDAGIVCDKRNRSWECYWN